MSPRQGGELPSRVATRSPFTVSAPSFRGHILNNGVCMGPSGPALQELTGQGEWQMLEPAVPTPEQECHQTGVKETCKGHGTECFKSGLSQMEVLAKDL